MNTVLSVNGRRGQRMSENDAHAYLTAGGYSRTSHRTVTHRRHSGETVTSMWSNANGDRACTRVHYSI